MTFSTEPEPARGIALDVIPGVRRIVAANPSVMTYHGTNTYLIEDGQDGLVVLDPGPDDPAHVGAIVRAGAGAIRSIVLSHTHSDHAGAAQALRSALGGVPVLAHRGVVQGRMVADGLLADGTMVAGLRVLHTPGHAADHICLEWHGHVVFSGDHVMGWASSIVSPPDGNMADYFASLRKMLERPHARYLCGHGPPVDDPHAHVAQLLAHRVRREKAILAYVRRTPSTTFQLMHQLYSKLDPWLRKAAERNVLAHLQKLQTEGLVRADDAVWRGA